jgi:hypothetical protein
MVAVVNELALVNCCSLDVHIIPLLLVALDPAVIFTAPGQRKWIQLYLQQLGLL